MEGRVFFSSGLLIQRLIGVSGRRSSHFGQRKKNPDECRTGGGKLFKTCVVDLFRRYAGEPPPFHYFRGFIDFPSVSPRREPSRTRARSTPISTGIR